MIIRSKVRRIFVVALAVGGVSLAVMWPTWRTVLAGVGGYDTSFLGCVTDDDNEDQSFVVVFVDGPDVSLAFLGGSCADALNSLSGCSIDFESQTIDPKEQKSGTMFRMTCIPQ